MREVLEFDVGLDHIRIERRKDDVRLQAGVVERGVDPASTVEHIEYLTRLVLEICGGQPGPIDALAYYSTIVTRLGSQESPGVTLTALGNPELKPERSTEFEAGIDGTFWDNRINAEFTYYNKDSRDALINRVLPPSIGTGATTRLENLGQVKNTNCIGAWPPLCNAGAGPPMPHEIGPVEGTVVAAIPALANAISALASITSR